MAKEKKQISYRDRQKGFIDQFPNTTVFVHNGALSVKMVRELQVTDIIDGQIRALIGNGDIKGGDVDKYHEEYSKLQTAINELNLFGAKILAKSTKTKISNNKAVRQLVDSVRKEKVAE